MRYLSTKLSRILSLACLSLASASLFTGCPDDRSHVPGIVVMTWEKQLFVVPDENNQEYWLAQSDLLKEFPSLSKTQATRYKVVLSGKSVSGGHFGHLGKWDKEFLIEKIEEKELIKD